MSRRKLVVGAGVLGSYSSASQVDIPFHTLTDETGKSGSDYTDALMRWKYLFIFGNSMLGVCLMMLELQVTWDGKELVWSKAARTLRFLITFLTILLIVQLLDYYNGLLAVMTNVWKSTRINSGFNFSVWSVVRSSPVVRMFWGEVIVCALHAPPVQAINSKWALLMFLRFYMVFKLIRDRSIIYRRRNTIMRKYVKYGIRHWGPPKFDWFLATKSLFVRRPFPFVFLVTLWTLVVCGYSIYIFEREYDPVKFTFFAGLYLSVISMITGWPTDTYEDYWPFTVGGRASCILSTLLGLFLLSMLLEVFSGWFVATPHQRPAIVWAHRQDIKRQLRHAAARVIQLVWLRHARSTFRATASYVREKKATKCGITAQSLGTRYVTAVKEFRRLMRQKVSLHINFVESQYTGRFVNQDDDPPSSDSRSRSDDDDFPENDRPEVEDRLRAMEALIHSLTLKIDSLVTNSNHPREGNLM